MDPTLALSSPAQLPPAFPLQTAESRDRLTASWVTMNSVGQCWKVCWVTTDASRAFPSAATHVSWSQGTDQGLLSSLAARSGSRAAIVCSSVNRRVFVCPSVVALIIMESAVGSDFHSSAPTTKTIFESLRETLLCLKTGRVWW